MDSFDAIFERAAQRKGGAKAVETLLPKTKSAAALRKISDDRWLSAMTKVIFQAGFVWKVVENKWPAFEDAFHGFHPARVAAMHDEELEALMKNDAIIRNFAKIKAAPHNARMLCDLAAEHGSAARFFADWPANDIVGLYDYLKKHGKRLSGSSAQFLLRQMGKDTFVFSRDVVAALIAQGIVDKEPKSKAALAKVQTAFNAWAEESGRPLAHISRTLALSTGPTLEHA